MTKGVPTCSSAGGNTKPTARSVNPAKNWCFTWNNYPENWEEICVPVFRKQSQGYVIGKEIAPSGTPHLQGYVESIYPKKIRPITEFKLPVQIKWIAAKGKRDENQSYCSKDDDYISWGTCTIKLPYTINIELFEWQKIIVDILNTPPDDRKIYWFWEEEGCAGKTTFQKWIFLNFENVAVLSGKATDMKNGIIKFHDQHQNLPVIVLINIPRCQEVDHVSWQGIEEIKDMFFFSGKYEGGMICGPNPHVIIFSNQEPPLEKLSGDRWVVTHI